MRNYPPGPFTSRLVNGSLTSTSVRFYHPHEQEGIKQSETISCTEDMRRPGKRGKNTRLFCESFEIFRGPASKATLALIFTILISLGATVTGCQSATERQDVRPLVLRDVPAQHLAYRLEADTGLPPEIKTEDSNALRELVILRGGQMMRYWGPSVRRMASEHLRFMARMTSPPRRFA